MPWNAYTSHTSVPPLHLQLSPMYPSSNTLINRARRPCVISEPQPDMPGSTRYALFTLKPGLQNLSLQLQRLSLPLLPLLWVLRSGQCAEIALIYTQQLQRREVLLIGCSNIDVALPNFTCRGTWSICWCIQEEKDSGRNTHQQLCWCQCAQAIFNQRVVDFAKGLHFYKASQSASMCPEPPASLV